MYGKWFRTSGLLLALILLCSCGKNLPVITYEQLNHKLAVLIVTSTDLSQPVQESIHKALLNWRQSQNISFEWMQSNEEPTAELKEKLKDTGYDYIYVLGNELGAKWLPVALQLPERKWVMLQDNFLTEEPALTGNHLTFRSTTSAYWMNQWDDWVKTQQKQGLEIEWVTDSARPIPSAWAPSEEADHIVLTDTGTVNAIYNQLSFQQRQHNSKWIAVYSQADAALLQRLKALNVPIINMYAMKLELNWDVILSNCLDAMLKNGFQPGMQPYTDSEITAVKK